MASQGGKSIPRKARSASRKTRRVKNLGTQVEKKLRHILKRNTLREAFEWADANSAVALLRTLRPDFQDELAAIGKGQ